MKIVRIIFKYVLYFLLIPISYVAVSFILGAITVDRSETQESSDKTIYLASNGVHLDIVLPKESIDSLLLADLIYNANEDYLAFGWGDENFYLNTPTWGDLTMKTAIKAVFFKSPSLIHITRFRNKQRDWIEIKITKTELRRLNSYIFQTFILNKNQEKILLKDQGYTLRDDFYKAKGHFYLFKTCNSWVNTGFKESGLKACLWTPFDFGLMNKYK
ncbi:DUF2459 domain-containing protein [Marivirga tractuosa]|uniref:DUF2459 domain-containing protein n=1 Tax=Marivirga tractuosa TaxID=1006 RepID=UPI0035D0C68C